MPKLPSSDINIELSLPNSSPRQFDFHSPDEVIHWAAKQMDRIADIAPEYFPGSNVWSMHISHIKLLIQTAERLKEVVASAVDTDEDEASVTIGEAVAQVERFLNPYRKGGLITSFHNNFHLALYFSNEEDYSSASAVIQASQVNGFKIGDAPLRGANVERAVQVAISLHALSVRSEQPAAQWRSELGELYRDYSSKCAALGHSVEVHGELIKDHDASAIQVQSEQRAKWSEHLAETKEEWQGMKAVYDEQLALLAPTEYWATRSKSHFRTSLGFAAVFGVAVTIALSGFFGYAIPYLHNVHLAPEPATLVSALPVLIPAFAIVWVLRMLARQLSENLTLMQDARERETMVKTFLAFMRDQASGKAVVTDQDRAVILHSLFRPSTVTATDDSPPLSVLERISGRRQ